MRFNPTLVYFTRLQSAFLLGIGWCKAKDNVGTPTWNLMLYFGPFFIRIERGI